MQTFLPSPNFDYSARALDERRLGKQIVECLQIYRAITRPDYGWQNHPAVNQWRGYESALLQYADAMHDEWLRRGHTEHGAYQQLIIEGAEHWKLTSWRLPPWLGDDEYHRSHRSALVRKFPAHYAPMFPDGDIDAEYIWPVAEAQERAVSLAESWNEYKGDK